MIEKAKAVLRIVNDNSLADWRNDEQWMSLLPPWFMQRCAPERTQEEEERLGLWQNSLNDGNEAPLPPRSVGQRPTGSTGFAQKTDYGTGGMQWPSRALPRLLRSRSTSGRCQRAPCAGFCVPQAPIA